MSVINNHVKTKFEKQIGNGTVNNYYSPFYWYYKYGYGGFIYTKEELGISRPVNIKGIRLEYGRNDPANAKTALNQNIYLGQVNQDEFGSNVRNGMYQDPAAGWEATNIQAVKSNFAMSISSGTAFKEFLFDDYYNYDPSSTTHPHLLVYWKNRWGAFENGSLSPWVETQSTGKFDVYYDYSDYTSMTDADAGTRSSTGKPNIQLIIEV
jgi:hypothetical protein